MTDIGSTLKCNYLVPRIVKDFFNWLDLDPLQLETILDSNRRLFPDSNFFKKEQQFHEATSSGLLLFMFFFVQEWKFPAASAQRSVCFQVGNVAQISIYNCVRSAALQSPCQVSKCFLFYGAANRPFNTLMRFIIYIWPACGGAEGNE